MPERIQESESIDRKRLESVGIELNKERRSATFFQVDQDVKMVSSFFEGVEIMSIRDALKKYDWLKDYFWKAVDREKDDYTKEVAEDFNGYFIRAKEGAKIQIPVEACLYLRTRGLKQKVHNIIIAEEGSELNVITGCTSHPGVVSGMHIGISEFFVKKDAKLTFTMIHSWESGIEVRPRTGIIVEDNGVFINNYVLMSPVKIVQAYPVAYLNGENSRAVFNSIIVGLENSYIDVGSRAVLNGEKSSAEIISRTISKGGQIISRGNLTGNAPEVKGHLECRGLMLSEKGSILAIPELEARYPNIELSHEAAIGKIAEDEIFYLMARGFSRDEATAAIIRGFLDLEIKGIPPVLKTEIDKAISLVEKEIL
uniref:SufD family Fe-S cluster assembly protein n=1 Tax=Geoglobus ahangari TaxID=113653 RepID=A0A7C3YEF7_9EURY